MTGVQALLLTAVTHTNAEADFTATVDAQARRLYALALSVLGDPQEAEDALQETLEQAWRAWDSIDDPTRRGRWLATICLRTCMRWRHRLRARWHHAQLREEEPDPRQPGLQDIDLVRACRRLSPQQRSVVVLHYVYGYSLDECAEVMRCRAGTVRPHLRRALVKLREAYEDA